MWDADDVLSARPVCMPLAAFEMAFHDPELFPWCAAQRLPDAASAAQHILYATVKCYGAPFPDAEGRPPVLAVLALDEQGTSLRVVQETEFPKATGGAMVLQLNKSKSKLFVTAGTHGVAIFDVNASDQGKVVGGPVVSPTRAENLPTPLGVFPAWITIDNADATLYSCNFFSQDVTALPFDETSSKCGAPIGVCTPKHPGVPEKVVAQLDPVRASLPRIHLAHSGPVPAWPATRQHPCHLSRHLCHPSRHASFAPSPRALEVCTHTVRSQRPLKSCAHACACLGYVSTRQNAEPGPFGAGFPENGCHPHGISIHPSGKWMVLGDLGSNNFTVYSLPIGKSFTEGPPDFLLHSHTAPASYASYGSGPKNNIFSKDGTVLFSCNELDSSVSSYQFDESAGTLTPISSCSTLPQDWLDSIPPRPMPFYESAHSGGSLCLAPNGKHVYCTNRGYVRTAHRCRRAASARTHALHPLPLRRVAPTAAPYPHRRQPYECACVLEQPRFGLGLLCRRGWHPRSDSAVQRARWWAHHMDAHHAV